MRKIESQRRKDLSSTIYRILVSLAFGLNNQVLVSQNVTKKSVSAPPKGEFKLGDRV